MFEGRATLGQASGYVVDTVPLALRCAEGVRDRALAEVLAGAIRLGGDTDTVGSLTGQLAGAVLGGVLENDLARVEGIEDYRAIALRFAGFAGLKTGWDHHS